MAKRETETLNAAISLHYRDLLPPSAKMRSESILLAACCAAVSAKDPASTVLNEWPMIMVHDAATTYLQGGLLHQINDWAKTQPDGGAQGELNCGARGFDWRPSLQSDGTMKMHHGSVTIDHEMGSSLDEMVAWAAANGTAAADLVVLGITDCDGSGCAAAAQALLAARNITYVTECAELKGLTVGAAFAKAALPGGGAILATFDCWQENYDPAVACSGFGSTAPARAAALRDGGGSSGEDALEYTCYSDSSTRSFPVGRMQAYIKKTVAAGPPADGQLYTTQCIWQESAASVTVGELHGSSLLADESRSGLNALVRGMVADGSIGNTSKINFLEVNNVCDGGPQLLATLRAI